MASSSSFSKVTAARTRAAEFILNTPELRDGFIERGGLERDLVGIISTGKAAEAANLGQSVATADGSAVSATVADRFAQLQRDYKQVMAVLQAVRGDLITRAAATELIEQVERILIDETPVHIKVRKGEGDGSVKRALKRSSQEAIRAEIRKDAAAMLATPELAAPLAERKVDVTRLTQLRDHADALAGQLAERTAKKAERRAVTAAEHAAVREQARVWSSVSRILDAIPDDRVQALLSESRWR